MAGTNFTVDQTGLSRVFLIEGQARRDHEPEYMSCGMAGGVSKSFGDTDDIECPDPDRYDNFIVMGELAGSDERATMTLTNRYAADVASRWMEVARRRCLVDVQIHFGICENPSLFNTFSKALILEAARINNYGTDDLGTLDSDGRAVVNETIDISYGDFYEVLQLTASEAAGSIVTNEVVDGVNCSTIQCGGVCAEDDIGCERQYFITKAAGGSPGTPADVVYTIDKGATWYAHDIDTLGAAEDPDGVACVGTSLVVVSNASNSLHYAPLADVEPWDDPAFAEVTTGFVVGGEPNDIWSVGNYAFVVGDGGYVYGTSDPAGGVTALDAGVATTLDLQAVHAIDSYFAVAVGNSGVIVHSSDQSTWGLVTPTNVLFTQNWQAVWVKNKFEWWICGATVAGVGQVWYTLDAGTTWYQVGGDGFPSISGTYAAFRDIQFPTDSIGYLCGDTATPAGRIFRSYDGGHSWQILPEGVTTLPANDRVNALASCSDDVNHLSAGGLADNGTDGYLVVLND